jgi:cytochrome P450
MVRDFGLVKPNGLYAGMRDLHRQGRMTAEQLLGETVAILDSADTLATAATSVLLCLASQPTYQQRILEAKRSPTAASTPDLAKHFVQEVLRMYPVFRLFGYESSTHPATHFLIDTWFLHRSADWANPHQFMPERFEVPGTAGGFKYLPFGMGPRSCPGRAFASDFLATLLMQWIEQGCAARISARLPAGTPCNKQGLPEYAKGHGALSRMASNNLEFITNE